MKKAPEYFVEAPVLTARNGRQVNTRFYTGAATAVERYNCRNFLEFGCGVSTVYWATLGIPVVSYETLDGWAQWVWEYIERDYPNCAQNLDIRLWDGEHFKDPIEHYDIAFVDGPGCGMARRESLRVASLCADIIFCHDYRHPVHVAPFIKEFLVPEKFTMETGIRDCARFFRKGVARNGT